LFCKAQWPELQFFKTGFKIIGDNYILEKEIVIGFSKGIYCPVNIGDVFASRYRVEAKLGLGFTSTVCWPATSGYMPSHVSIAYRLTSQRNKNYASLKMYKQQHIYHYPGGSEIYNILGKENCRHPGRNYIRTARDSFKIP
jgi:serine/threonine-protein kinase SRPK3